MNAEYLAVVAGKESDYDDIVSLQLYEWQESG